MAKKPRKKKHDWQSYPKPVSIESGCKVGWYNYLTAKDAREASVAARHNAAIKVSLGYDFGYCAPGSIEERYVLDHGVILSAFRVCVP